MYAKHKQPKQSFGAKRVVSADFVFKRHQPSPDIYDTIQLIALLQQVVSCSGFYDGVEFVSLERVQIVASMNPTVGRHILSPRFAAIVRIISVDYSTREELIDIPII